MAVRQYIGARYVPKFYEYNNGVWEGNTEYEPLTIVTYNGNSYTSKKTVPTNIGNPSSNPEYWASTGNYNAQVETYRQEVEAYKLEVDTELPPIKKDYELRTNRKYIFMGDSYDDTTNWVQHTVQEMGLTQNQYVNLAEGYRTFISNYTYLDKITTFVTSSTEEELASYTDLILLGGVGDAMNSAFVDFYLFNQIRDFVAYVKQHLPNITIRLGYIGAALDTYPSATDTNKAFNRTRAINEYKKIAKLGGIYLNGMEYVLQQRYYFTNGGGSIVDGLHPQENTGAGDAIATNLINCLRSGSTNVEYFGDGEITLTGADAGNSPVLAGYDNGTSFIDIRNITLTTTAEISYDYVTLATLPNWIPMYESRPWTQCVNVTSNNVDRLYNVAFIITEGLLKVKCGGQSQGGSAWDSIPSGSKLTIDNTRIEQPTLYNL